MLAITDIFPTRIAYQGDSWNQKIILTGYDSSIWTLTLTFRKQGSASFSIVSVPAVDGAFYLGVDATTTATWNPGNYYAAATISDGHDRVTLAQVEFLIKADLATVPSADPRSMNRRAYEDVEAALAAGAGSDVAEYTIAGTVVKKNRAGLLALRAHYLLRVRQEDGKAAIGVINYSL